MRIKKRIQNTNRVSKIMMLLLFAWCLNQRANAQDTVLMNNGTIIISRITEISSNQIKYKNFLNLDGPTYVIEKSSIQKIIFSNGVKETFDSGTHAAQAKQKTEPIDQDYYSANKPIINKDSKIEKIGGRFFMNGNVLNENKLHLQLMTSTNPEIKALIKRAKQDKYLQLIGFGGIVFGMASLITLGSAPQDEYTFNYQTGQNQVTKSRASERQPYYTTAALFALVGIACPISSIIFKADRKNSNANAVRLYNQTY
jgi:hypothetical protein